MRQYSLIKIFVAILLVIGLFPLPGLIEPAQAIGPGTGGSKIRVGDERVGPYVLLVATSPLPVTVGQMSVWVRVTDVQTDQLRRDSVVKVEATPRTGGPTITAAATHKNAGNDYDYVAHLEVGQSGQWDFTVYVEDEPGQVETAFTESVTRGLNAGLLIALAVPFVGIAVGVGIYLWRRSGQET